MMYFYRVGVDEEVEVLSHNGVRSVSKKTLRFQISIVEICGRRRFVLL